MTLRSFLDAAYTYLVHDALRPRMAKDGRMYPGATLEDALKHYEPFRAVSLAEQKVRERSPEAGVAAKNDQALRRLMGSVRMQGARG